MSDRFPDVLDELIWWLEHAEFDQKVESDVAVDASTRTPATWPTGVFLFARVALVGGSDDGITDNPLVDVDVFSNTYAAARGLAEDVRQGLRPRVRMRSATIDRVRTDVSPRELPWGNANVRRISATYQISFRR